MYSPYSCDVSNRLRRNHRRPSTTHAGDWWISKTCRAIDRPGDNSPTTGGSSSPLSLDSLSPEPLPALPLLYPRPSPIQSNQPFFNTKSDDRKSGFFHWRETDIRICDKMMEQMMGKSDKIKGKSEKNDGTKWPKWRGRSDKSHHLSHCHPAHRSFVVFIRKSATFQ